MSAAGTVQRIAVGLIEIVDANGNTLLTIDGPNQKISLPAGITVAGLTVPEIALANHKILIGDANGAAAAMAVTGDVTISDAGVTAIGAAKVTTAMLANGAGVAALITAGLGGTTSVAKTVTATATIVAAHATKDRAVIIAVTVDETFANVGGLQTTFTIGEEATLNKFMLITALVNATAGTVLLFGGTNTATKAIQVTSVARTVTGTGGISIAVLAIPTT